MPDTVRAVAEVMPGKHPEAGFIKERSVTPSEIYCAICSREKPVNGTSMALESICKHNKIFTYWA